MIEVPARTAAAASTPASASARLCSIAGANRLSCDASSGSPRRASRRTDGSSPFEQLVQRAILISPPVQPPDRLDDQVRIGHSNRRVFQRIEQDVEQLDRLWSRRPAPWSSIGKHHPLPAQSGDHAASLPRVPMQELDGGLLLAGPPAKVRGGDPIGFCAGICPLFARTPHRCRSIERQGLSAFCPAGA